MIFTCFVVVSVRDIRPNNGFLTQIAALDLQLFREKLERIRMEPSSSDTDSSSEEGTKSTADPESGLRRSSSLDSTDSSSTTISSTKSSGEKECSKEDSKSSGNESGEYHSAVSSVCSSSLSTKSEKFQAAHSKSVSVQLSLTQRRRRSNSTEHFVSRCIRIQNQSDDSLESDNDADDESSDSES